MPESLRVTLDFLRDLSRNNDREWFNQNKKRYTAAQAAFEDLVVQVISRFNEVEDFPLLAPKDVMYRIHRDVRFSPDKTPYKPWMGALVGKQGRKSPGRSYYIQIQPGDQSMLAGGHYMVPNEVLTALRAVIAEDSRPLRKALNAAAFKQYFGKMTGEQLKTAPKGYSKDHPDIDLLRFKQFLAGHTFTDEDVLRDDLVDQIIVMSKAMKPFLKAIYDPLGEDLLAKMMQPR